jgi:hypothetical protein
MGIIKRLYLKIQNNNYITTEEQKFIQLQEDINAADSDTYPQPDVH